MPHNLTAADLMGPTQIAYRLIEKFPKKELRFADVAEYLQFLGNTSKPLEESVVMSLRLFGVVFINEEGDVIYY